MATEHRLIPDPERHEPKGISSATIGQIYRSDGSASGAWKNDVVVINSVLPDVSEASSILIPINVDCQILSIKVVLGGPITVADSNITVTRGGDNASIASLVIPFSGSAEGITVNNNAPTNPNIIANTNNYIKLSSDGGSTDASPLYVSIKVKVVE